MNFIKLFFREPLASKYDVFACCVGDCDSSIDFVYYRNGTVVREYVYSEPWGSSERGEVVKNFGEPLPGESDALDGDDVDNTVLQIAASLGIKAEFNESDLRIYVAPDRAFREYMSTIQGIEL